MLKVLHSQDGKSCARGSDSQPKLKVWMNRLSDFEHSRETGVRPTNFKPQTLSEECFISNQRFMHCDSLILAKNQIRTKEEQI